MRQTWVREAPINIVIAAVYERTTDRYGDRGIRYVHMEAGHVGQNLYLQAEARGLGMVVVGAFHDEQVQTLLRLPADQKPLYIIPIGYPAG
jgi:SagB-type dehydrogenase family enzyme